MRLIGRVVLLALCAGWSSAAQTVVRPEFSAARGLSAWDIDGNGQWRMADGLLELHTAGVPAGPIRKPAAMAILKSEPVGDFSLTVELRSTAPADLDVRDVLLIFGYQSPTRFYYVHLSRRTDAVHNGIFLVNDADRKRLDPPTSRSPLLDQAWHRVRLVRNVDNGRAEVYFDDETAPVLAVSDTTLRSGRVGIGSFDETAEFRALVLTPLRSR